MLVNTVSGVGLDVSVWYSVLVLNDVAVWWLIL